MGEHFVFRLEGTEYEGMRLPVGLYTAIVATVERYGIGTARNFDHLLSKNTFKPRKISVMNNKLRDEFIYAGNIILKNKLLTFDFTTNKEAYILEKEHTPTKIAISLATAVELCDTAKLKEKSIDITIESGSPSHAKLSLEQTLNSRYNSWIYPYNPDSIFDYKEIKFKCK